MIVPPEKSFWYSQQGQSKACNDHPWKTAASACKLWQHSCFFRSGGLIPTWSRTSYERWWGNDRVSRSRTGFSTQVTAKSADELMVLVLTFELQPVPAWTRRINMAGVAEITHSAIRIGQARTAGKGWAVFFWWNGRPQRVSFRNVGE